MNPTKPITFTEGAVPQVGTKEYEQAQKGVAPQGFTNITKNPSPITVDTLTTNPTATTAPTAVNNNTAQTALTTIGMGAVGTEPPPVDTKPKTDATTTKKTLNDRLLGILGVQEGKSDFVAEQQKEQQLVEKNAELTRLNNEALTVQKNFSSQIKDLEKTFTGSPQGRQDALNNLYRQRDDALANIRIDQAIAQNNIALAQQTIQTMVDAKYEPLENQLKTLQLYREFISDDLTEEETIKLTAQENRYKSNAESIRDTGKAVLEAVVASGGQSTIPAIQKAMDEENRKLQENPNYTPDVSKIYAAGGTYVGKKDDSLTGLDSDYRTYNYLQKIGDPSVKNMSYLQFKEAVVGAGKTPPVNSQDQYKKAQQFVLDNPDASASELEQGIRGNTTGLTEGEISSLIKEKETNLTRESISNLYDISDDDDKTNFFGFGKTNKEKLDDIMDSIEKYRKVGYSDKEILKLIQE